MKNTPPIFDDTDLWESRQLGASEEYAEPVGPEKTKAIQKALGLEDITVRMQTELVDQLKKLAKGAKLLDHKVLIRRILTQYVQDAAQQKRKRA